MLFYESEVLLPVLEVWVLLLTVLFPTMLLVFVAITSFDFESAENTIGITTGTISSNWCNNSQFRCNAP